MNTWVTVEDEILDFRTAITGLDAESIRKLPSIPFQEAQRMVRRFVAGKILVGHALENDFEALGMSHPPSLVRDTATQAALLPPGRFAVPSLKLLVQHWLKEEMHTGVHNSVEDARMALRLYLLHAVHWELSILPTLLPTRRHISAAAGNWVRWPRRKTEIGLEEDALTAAVSERCHKAREFGSSKSFRNYSDFMDSMGTPWMLMGTTWGSWGHHGHSMGTRDASTGSPGASRAPLAETEAPEAQAVLPLAAEARAEDCAATYSVRALKTGIVTQGPFAFVASVIRGEGLSSLSAVRCLQVLLLGISAGCISCAILMTLQSIQRRAEMAVCSMAFEVVFCAFRAALAFRSGWAIARGPLCTDLRRKLFVV